MFPDQTEPAFTLQLMFLVQTMACAEGNDMYNMGNCRVEDRKVILQSSKLSVFFCIP